MLGKWSCILSKTIKDMQVDESFDQSVKYYIRKEGVYYTVRSKGSVLKVLKSRKRAGPVYQAAKAGFQARSRGSHRSRGETV